MSDEIPNGREPALGGQNTSDAPSLSINRLLPGLREALESKDRKERLKIVGTLLGSDAPPVAPMLVQLMNTTSDGVTRQRCIAMLGQLRDAQAVEPLVGLLNEEDANLRKIAAWALGQIGDARAVEPLVDLLQHEADRRIVSVIVASLAEIGDLTAVSSLLGLREATEEGPMAQSIALALRMLAQSCPLTPLIEMLTSDQAELRNWAADRFVHHRERPQVEHVAALEGLLSYPHRADIRHRAIHLLAKIDDTHANRLVLTALSHPDESMRLVAFKAVENEKIQNALDILFERYDHETELNVGALIKAIGALDDPRIVPFLLNKLGAGGTGWQIASCLRRGEHPEVAGLLLERTQTAEGEVRLRYLEALRYFNTPEVVEALLRCAHLSIVENERMKAVDAVDVMACPDAIPGLLDILHHDPSEQVKRNVIWQLSDNLTDEVEDALRNLLAGPESDYLRATALNALADHVADAPQLLVEQLQVIKDEEALCILVRRLDMLSEDEEDSWLRRLYQAAKTPRLRNEVLDEYPRIPHSYAIPFMLEVLHKDPSPDVRLMAAYCLGHYYLWQEDYPVIEELSKALDDDAAAERPHTFYGYEIDRMSAMVEYLLTDEYAPEKAVAAISEWRRRNGRLE